MLTAFYMEEIRVLHIYLIASNVMGWLNLLMLVITVLKDALWLTEKFKMILEKMKISQNLIVKKNVPDYAH